MKITFDLVDEIKSGLSKAFGNLIDIEQLEIEFSSVYPKEYQTITHNWTHDNIKIGIERYYEEYDVTRRKVILYLPVISEPCSMISHRYDRFTRVILFFGVGQWISHNIKCNGRPSTNDNFMKVGPIYRNFMALMYTYSFIKHEQSFVEEFRDVIDSLSDEYTLCLKFIKNSEYNLPGVELSGIIALNQEVIEVQQECITHDAIMDFHSIDQYVDECINSNPEAIKFFKDVMTQKQKKKWDYLLAAVKVGFFDD